MKCNPVSISSWDQRKVGPFTIVIAKTSCQKQQGLQGIKAFNENTLILFLNMFGGGYFHTKNCFFPIDIISLDSSNKILNAWTAIPNLSAVGPMPFGTDKVLEAKAGWMTSQNLKIGDIIPFIKKAS